MQTNKDKTAYFGTLDEVTPEIYAERRASAKAERDKRKAHDEQEL